MTIGTQHMTAKEFLALPPDDIRNELVHGEVILIPSPNLDHAYAVTKLTSLLDRYIETNGLGELYGDIDAYFGPDDARRPDILFYQASRIHLISPVKKPEVPPDLCIEVLSPSNAGYDRTDKFDLYQTARVPFYWIVDPMERTIEAYRLVNDVYIRSGHGTGDEMLKLSPFDDLEIRLARLWRPVTK